MKTIELAKTASTNSWVAENADALEAPCIVYALEQTAGRGQRGNSWEAAPDMNLTASALLRPEGVEAAGQFAISEAVALAVTDVLASLGVEAKVKWPNDVYVADRKICGILIEHSVYGRAISRSVAGIGINVNQTVFLSDAPNPVSLRQLTGRHFAIPDIATLLGKALASRMEQCHGSRQTLHDEFMGKLWRGDGAAHPFLDRRLGEEIAASILSVAPDGTLTLRLESGETRSYAFKEVEFLLNRQ